MSNKRTGVHRNTPKPSRAWALDVLWTARWIIGLGALLAWDAVFLHELSFALLRSALVNTLLGAAMAALASLGLGWMTAFLLDFLEHRHHRLMLLALRFLLNLIRSVPQIIGILGGFVLLTMALRSGLIVESFAQIVWSSMVVSMFCFREVVDVLLERIRYYRASDFVPAMLCCGISESRVVNIEIVWKNSRAYLLHKLTSLFGIAIFLQCSLDFIVSVGLSTEVSSSNFPTTLGSLLAKLDSKQDILALGSVMFDPSSLATIPFQHLLGVSVAFIIVYSLICMHQISEGIVRRYDL